MPLGFGTLVASASVAQVAATAFDKAAEFLFGAKTRAVVEEVQDRLRAYTGEVPRNHDLEHGIRSAELTASIAIVDYARRKWEGDNFDTRAAEEPPFFQSAKAWLHTQIGICPSLKAVPNDEIVTELNNALDSALASRMEKANAVLADTATREWDLLAEGAQVKAPSDFEALFLGQQDGEPSWAVFFVAFVREQLKDKPRAQVAFVITRLAGVSEALRRSERLSQSIKDDTSRLVAIAEEERQGRGIAEGFIHEMAGRIAASSDLEFEGKMEAVRNSVELYATEIAGARTQINLGDVVDRTLAKAMKLVAEGKSGLACAALREAAENLRRDEDERRSRYAESARVLYGRQCNIALAAYDGEAAADAYVAMAEALHPGHAERISETLSSEAARLFNHGRDRGSNVHLIAAISLRRRLLAFASTPDKIGVAQTNLGSALATLGGRESGTARLEEAVAAHRAALREINRTGASLVWAQTQSNLGSALATLGGRESGTARLEEAVAAYRAALKEMPRRRVPLHWARTQHKLGGALRTLGGRESRTARLEEAVAAYRAALEERTRARLPLQWAQTQSGLGSALATLGGRESGTARLEEAVAAYRAALEERTRARLPLQWAATQDDLGTTLRVLGERESGTARLEEAIAAHRAALEEMTRTRVPLDWAIIQDRLGTTLRVLGERESGTARLEEAIAAHRAALEEMTRTRVPLDWAVIQDNLGTTLRVLGERESGTARLEEAIAAHRAALEEMTRTRVPLDWAATQSNLGSALATLGERESGTARLEEAVAAYRAALKERTRARLPLQWAQTQHSLDKVSDLIRQRNH